MEVIIGDKIKVKTFRSVYVIDVRLMHGDGDHYDNEEVVISADKIEYVKEVLQLLKDMSDIKRNDRRKKYASIDLFNVWFGNEYYGEWTNRITREEVEEKCQYSFEWPHDITSEGTRAMMDRYKVYYFDEDGIKYNVNVIY